jgi:hypothetical protein
MKPAPPPLPPRAKKPPLPLPHPLPQAPRPSDDGVMSTRAKLSLADIALALREEQVQARVVHYRAELETSPELDAITAQVVAGLQELQRAVAHATKQSQPPPLDRSQVEIELIKNLKVSLSHLFRPDKLASLIERKLAEASKRFARFFFESALHEKMAGGKQEVKKISYAEQALFHVLSRLEPQIAKELETYEYASPEVLERAQDTLSGIIKEYRNEFLGRTTPELNALVKILNEVMHAFFTAELPPVIGELAWEVVKEARLADGKLQAGYKVSADAFPAFRQAFEKRFLQRLVTYAEDGLLKRVVALGDRFRVDTIRFVAEPQIFSDMCELICDAVYDSLYNDGFLDLPADWRARLSASTG